MRRLAGAILVLGLCVGAAPPRTDVCTRVLLRALSFDRNLERRVGDEAVLLVAYNSRDEASMRALQLSQAERARLLGTRLGGADLRIHEVDLRTMEEWATVVDETRPDAVMLLPGTGAWTSAIADSAPGNYVTLGHGHDTSGVAISVSLGADDRPSITVDRSLAAQFGMDLSSQLLRLAVVR